MTARVIHGDCLEAMRQLIAEGVQVDSVICDPPYHLQSITSRLGAADASPIKHGTDGAYARAAAGFMGKTWDGGGISFEPRTWQLALMLLKPGGHLLAFGGTRTFHRIAVAIEDAGAEIRDTICWLYGSGFPKSHNQKGEWEGWGTALKPAWEPIIVAQRPFDGSVAANLGRHGVGAINIDGCRIHGEDAQGGEYRVRRLNPDASVNATGLWKQDRLYEGEMKAGRWPANVIHDGSEEVLDAFPDAPGQMVRARTDSEAQGNSVYGALKHITTRPEPRVESDKSAARFFYCAKASKAERAESKHPTVKPLALMRYLCRLVTPPGGTVLDPFAGSGTTGEAAILEGFAPILIEREDEYMPDIERRIERAAGADRGGA